MLYWVTYQPSIAALRGAERDATAGKVRVLARRENSSMIRGAALNDT